MLLRAYVIANIPGKCPTGVVVFKQGTTTLGISKVEIQNGIAVAILNLPNEIEDVVAYYCGDKNFAPSRTLTKE